MKIHRKFIQGLMLLALIMVAGVVHAQQQSVFDVTKKIGITPKKQVHLFLEEENPLKYDGSLYCINPKKDSVVVAALVCNETSNKDGRGDYSTYWKDSQGVINRYTWVFIPENFIQVCKSKGILPNCCTSERLCKLLGLGTGVQRDTIVYMKVPKDSLFRPAYVTKTNKILSEGDIGKNANINQLNDKHRKWMVGQQMTNDYPWTRMGYTFDWGVNMDEKNKFAANIGVAEFVIKPNTKYAEFDYITINEIQTPKGLWPGCGQSNQ